MVESFNHSLSNSFRSTSGLFMSHWIIESLTHFFMTETTDHFNEWVTESFTQLICSKHQFNHEWNESLLASQCSLDSCKSAKQNKQTNKSYCAFTLRCNFGFFLSYFRLQSKSRLLFTCLLLYKNNKSHSWITLLAKRRYINKILFILVLLLLLVWPKCVSLLFIKNERNEWRKSKCFHCVSSHSEIHSGSKKTSSNLCFVPNSVQYFWHPCEQSIVLIRLKT